MLILLWRFAGDVQDGNMAVLAECHDFLPQAWNKDTVAAKCFN